MLVSGEHPEMPKGWVAAERFDKLVTIGRTTNIGVRTADRMAILLGIHAAQLWPKW